MKACLFCRVSAEPHVAVVTLCLIQKQSLACCHAMPVKRQ